MADLIELDRATLGDRGIIFDMHVDSVTSQCGSHYSDVLIDQWFVGRTADNYTGAIEYGAVWIAKIGDVEAGFTEVFPGLISMMFVRGGFSGRGVGRRLMEFAMERAADGEVRVIKLDATLNAQAFYEKFGFEKVGDSQIERPSGLKLPTVLMERRAGGKR